MKRRFFIQTEPRIAVVLLSSIGNIVTFDERGNEIPKYCGGCTEELRDKILETASGNVLFYSPGYKPIEKKEFVRRCQEWR
jgi:hypothetical protein